MFYVFFLCERERSEHPPSAKLIGWSIAERSGLRCKPLCVYMVINQHSWLIYSHCQVGVGQPVPSTPPPAFSHVLH